jgi:hypothetical protein
LARTRYRFVHHAMRRTPGTPTSIVLTCVTGDCEQTSGLVDNPEKALDWGGEAHHRHDAHALPEELPRPRSHRAAALISASSAAPLTASRKG